MTERKWTPGPWDIKMGTLVDATRNTSRPVEVSGLCMAHFSGGSQAKAHQVANAHLIAAAPDLYEALDDLTIAIGMGWDIDGVVEVARAALAKARGEQ